MKSYELTITSISHPPAPFSEEEAEELGVKLSLGRKRVGRKWV